MSFVSYCSHRLFNIVVVVVVVCCGQESSAKSTFSRPYRCCAVSVRGWFRRRSNTSSSTWPCVTLLTFCVAMARALPVRCVALNIDPVYVRGNYRAKGHAFTMQLLWLRSFQEGTMAASYSASGEGSSSSIMSGNGHNYHANGGYSYDGASSSAGLSTSSYGGDNWKSMGESFAMDNWRQDSVFSK